MSPLTEKLPLFNSFIDLEYWLLTNEVRSFEIWISSSIEISITCFLNSLGFPIPYMHETDATTIMSFLPYNKDEVALSLYFSICSFIDKSFSIYSPDEGI